MTTQATNAISADTAAQVPVDGAGAMSGAIAAISEARAIVLACHVNPDGDALGSLIGLGIAIGLKFPRKDVTLLSRDGVPDIYRFLPFSDQVLAVTDRRDFDLAIVVDSGDLARVGNEILPIIQSATTLMDIDHHVGEGSFGAHRLLSAHASATAEIVYDMIEALGVSVTPEIARCLLTGIITDTGSFRFMNVTPRSLRIAASLIESGASPAVISEQVFDNREFGATRLLGAALSQLYNNDGRITWACVSRSIFDATETDDEDTEGLVNFVRAVRGSEIAVLFREFKPGVVRISLRCTGEHDVSRIAADFGGGGHKMASGCSYHGTLEAAVAALVAACKAALKADDV